MVAVQTAVIPGGIIEIALDVIQSFTCEWMLHGSTGTGKCNTVLSSWNALKKVRPHSNPQVLFTFSLSIS